MVSAAPDAGRDNDAGRQIRVVANTAALNIAECVIEACDGDYSQQELKERLRVAIMNANRETAKSWGMNFADDHRQPFYSHENRA